MSEPRTEAAARLLREMKAAGLAWDGWWEMLDRALAAERQRTVERIRTHFLFDHPNAVTSTRTILRILDAALTPEGGSDG